MPNSSLSRILLSRNLRYITLNPIITDKKLFIANWSLSESPLKLRKIIFNKIINFDYILISYQEKFEKINNHLYFSDIAKKFNHKKFIVRLFKIPFMNFLRLSNNNYYLFVKKIRLS